MRQLVVLSVVAIVGACSPKSEPPATDAAEVIHLAASDVSPPMRDLAKRFLFQRGRDEFEAEPVRRIPHPSWAARRADAVDPVVQSAMPALPIPAPNVTFEGLGAGIPGFQPGGVPPDTDGDIGDTQYVEVVNTSWAVFSRTGQILLGPAPTGMVFSGFAGQCGTSNDGDATVRYDHIAKRWVIAQFSIGAGAGGPYFQCVAVSKTSDATGQYARFQFNYTALNDYPKMGLWPDAYVFTYNMFNLNPTAFLGSKVCAMDRTKMLAGDPTATMQCFDTGTNFGGLLAADVDGRSMPPAGAPNYLVTLDSDTTLAYWKLKVDFATPANSRFTGPTSVTVAGFTPLCNGGTCVVQPAGGVQLDSLADRPMNRFVYRRFIDHESLIFSHSVARAGGGGGVRWYELRTPEAPAVFQQGTFAPDAAFRWMPSIAMDGAGNIATIYSTSSAAISPSVRYAGRLASDPPGTFGQGEGSIVVGSGVQTGLSRWGDYAALNIDPVDDCTFWGAEEYKSGNGSGNWRTRIGSFAMPSCDGFLAATDSIETVEQGKTATYTINTTTTAGMPQQVALSAMGLPAGVTAAFNPATVTSGQAAQLTLTAEPTATVGPTSYTIAAAGKTSQMINVGLTVTAKPEAPDAGGGGGDDTGGSESGGCCGTSPGAPAGSLVLALGVLLVLRRRRS